MIMPTLTELAVVLIPTYSILFFGIWQKNREDKKNNNDNDNQ